MIPGYSVSKLIGEGGFCQVTTGPAVALEGFYRVSVGLGTVLVQSVMANGTAE